MTLPSGTSRRLLFAFAALVGLFGIASYVALAGYSEIHEELHRIKHHEAGAQTALELANAVRDQYVLQAQTILVHVSGDLTGYEEARKRVLTLVAQARNHTPGPHERQLLDDIELVGAELDRLFRTKILPGLPSGNLEALRQHHARARDLLSFVQEQADRLASRLRASIGSLEQHTATVQHAAFRWMVFFLAASTLFAAAVGIYIGRSVARPVALLEKGAAALARGDLSTRIHLDATDEFGRLAAQFNMMTVALSSHQQKLVQSERLAGIGRLAAGVAHEINNPLGVILGYVRVMRKRADLPLDQDLRVIEEEAVRCQEIVEGLLDLSRPQSVSADPVDLRQVCDEAVSRLNEAFQLAEVAVHVDGSGRVAGHRQRLWQVILNLIKNAVEAAGESGRVDIGIAPVAPGHVAVRVKDSGPGISPEVRERLFEPFFTTKPTGTGLGLAVSRAIAEAHGGEIIATSSPAGGAVFELRLPAWREESV